MEYMIIAWRHSTIFQWLSYLAFPPVMYENSNFSMFLPALTVSCIFPTYVPVRMKYYLIMVLICIFLLGNGIEHLFHLLSGYLSIYIEWSIQIICLFELLLKLLHCSGPLSILAINSLTYIYDFKYFLPFCRLYFHFWYYSLI